MSSGGTVRFGPGPRRRVALAGLAFSCAAGVTACGPTRSAADAPPASVPAGSQSVLTTPAAPAEGSKVSAPGHTPLGEFGAGPTPPGASTPTVPATYSGSAANRPPSAPTSAPVPSTGVPSTGASAVRVPGGASSGADQQAASASFTTYLYDLSGLLDTLNESWIPKIQAVTTTRLAQASVRTAAALLYSHEHGLGVLHDDQLTIRVISSTQALVTDCEDQYHFYLVTDSDGQPDPAIQRGYFTGTAVLVYQQGHWLVDVYRPSSATCHF